MRHQLSTLRNMITEDVAMWRKKNCITLMDISREQIGTLLHVAAELKIHDLKREVSLRWEYPRTLAMLFQKPSLRTRVSFEVSMAHLQGHAVYLNPEDVGLGIREAVSDVAGALSRWVDAITARVFSHSTLEELASNATIPVINALSDREHPIQAFADLLTLQEQCGMLGNDRTLAYLGDGNNVLHALMIACSRMGVNLRAACPEGYGPAEDYIRATQIICGISGATFHLTTDPVEAVEGAEALYTDVWTSMGQEDEKEHRLKVFTPYQVNSALLRHALPGAIVMHCLPAHRGEEITAHIMAQHQTVMLDQAENRLHTQKALLMLILGI